VVVVDAPGVVVVVVLVVIGPWVEGGAVLVVESGDVVVVVVVVVVVDVVVDVGSVVVVPVDWAVAGAESSEERTSSPARKASAKRARPLLGGLGASTMASRRHGTEATGREQATLRLLLRKMARPATVGASVATGANGSGQWPFVSLIRGFVAADGCDLPKIG
jgi:hypothetical protein